ncbi:DUF6098 family protein [Streptantibioticus rubrisoli]|uniref:DUF6098 family protein n=1 Tax=Streptantibioticus rubrisoli TaxID=1387313 RepID=A0ABT1P7S5_9ACTN|nr:DUF6098 family protein [Streptantibioticus rubrisoli]MCQ4041424.1 DUF6098 family protein [Streptantibioticus rubrisoli]
MGSARGEPLATLMSLDDVADLVQRSQGLYVRWSHDPRADVRQEESVDGLSGVRLPGLSVNALDLEPWWAGHSVRLWVARRLHDYSHLPREQGPGVRPWVLHGEEVGRGPDNEPLVRDARPIAWIDDRVIAEAAEEVARQEGRWGPMRRPPENA